LSALSLKFAFLLGTTLISQVRAQEYHTPTKKSYSANQVIEGINEQMLIIASSSKSVFLNDKPIFVPLIFSESVDNNIFASRIKTLAPPKKFYVIVRNLCAARQPGVTYGIYLNQPTKESLKNNSPYYVGDLNFYNAVIAANCISVKNSKFFSFNVTNLLKDLQVRKLLKEQITLTISPEGTPEIQANPVIGQIELVEQ